MIPELIITGYQAFTLSIFVSIVSEITLNCSNNLYLLEGVQQGDTSWNLIQTISGPRTTVPITFSMTNDGQIYYTSGNTVGWLSTTFQYTPPYGSLNNALFDTVNISKYLAISGSVSGTVNLTAPSVIATNYSLTLPSVAAPTDGNYALVQQPSSGLGWQKMPDALTFFAGSDNIITPMDVTGLLINTDHKIVAVFVQITALVSFNTSFLLSATQQPDSTWELNIEINGGPIDTGIVFTINSSGQIQYTSALHIGWVSTTFEFEAIASVVTKTNGCFMDILSTSTRNAYNGTTGAIQTAGGIGAAGSICSDMGLFTKRTNWVDGFWNLNVDVAIDSSGNQVIPSSYWELVQGANLSVSSNGTLDGLIQVPVKGLYSINWNVTSNVNSLVVWFAVITNASLPRLGYTVSNSMAFTVNWTGVLNELDTIVPVIGSPANGVINSVTSVIVDDVLLPNLGTTLSISLIQALY